MREVQAPQGMGVRRLTLADQLPACTIRINAPLYSLGEMAAGKRVADIGCGFGRNRPVVEAAGGSWTGVEPFEGGAHTVSGRAEALPFDDASFDIAVMDAVLEHVEDVDGAFAEVARVLVPGGAFVGYCAFMECFHEISYNHLSWKALEYHSRRHGMRLEALGGGTRFGIDYHMEVIAWPLPIAPLRWLVTRAIRGAFRAKAGLAYAGLRLRRRMGHDAAARMARDYYRLECLRQSIGFDFVIRKPGSVGA